MEGLCLWAVIFKVADPDAAAGFAAAHHDVYHALHVGDVVEDEVAEDEVELVSVEDGVVGVVEELDAGGNVCFGGGFGREHGDHAWGRVYGVDAGYVGR